MVIATPGQPFDGFVRNCFDLKFRLVNLVRQKLATHSRLMTDSKLFDSIRIKPRGAKKAEEEARKAAQCEWDSCEKPGGHKAPKGRNRDGEYYNFCIDHVREYNKNYNHFSGLADDEIARYQKENITGHRPTWKIGSNKSGKVDESVLRATPAWHNKVRNKAGARPVAGTGARRKLKRLEAKAMRDLGLPETATGEQIRTKYKELVKQNHPDANKGDRSTEDRLRQILQAYKQLKQAGLC